MRITKLLNVKSIWIIFVFCYASSLLPSAKADTSLWDVVSYEFDHLWNATWTADPCYDKYEYDRPRIISFRWWIYQVFTPLLDVFYLDECERVKRNTPENFDTALTNVQMLSRVVNAISIQQGLINGTIPSDEFISEILNFGSLTSSELSAVDESTMKQMIASIDGLGASLETSTDIQRLEDRFLLYGSMLQKNEAFESQARKIPQKDAYIQAVKTLIGKKLDLKKISGFAFDLDEFIQSINTVRSDGNEGKLKSALKSLNSIKGVDLSSYKTSMESDILRKGKSIFLPLAQVRESIEDFLVHGTKVDNAKDSSHLQKIGSNLKKLKATADSAKTAQPMIQTLHQLFVSSQHRRGNKDLVHTAAFTNGAASLQTVFDDLNKEWIKIVVQGQADQLYKALYQLKIVYDKSSLVMPLLTLDAAEVQSINAYFTAASELLSVADSITPLGTQLTAIVLSGDAGTLKPNNHGVFEKVLTDIDSLTEKMIASDDVLTLFSVLQAQGDIAKLISFLEKTETDEELDATLKTVKSGPQFDAIFNRILQKESSLKLIAGPRSFNVLADVDKNINQYDAYVSGLATYLGKIKAIKAQDGSKSMQKVFTTIRNSRGFKPAGTMQKTLQHLGPVKSKMSDLQIVVGKLKGFISKETNALVHQKSVSAEAKNIGSATHGVSSMKSLMDLDPVKLNTLKTHAQVVATAKAGGYSGAELDEADKQNLDEFLKLSSSLDDVIKDINAFKTGFIGPAPSNITTQTEIFKAASGINGLPLDFLAISGSVKKLVGQGQSFKESVKILETLDTIGLDFASRQIPIPTLKTSLDTMDTYFASFKRALNPVKKPSNPSGGASGPMASTWKSLPMLASEEEADPGFIKKYPEIFWSIIGLICLAVLAFSVWLIYYFFFAKRNKKNDKEKENHPVDDLEKQELQVEPTQKSFKLLRSKLPDKAKYIPYYIMLECETFGGNQKPKCTSTKENLMGVLAEIFNSFVPAKYEQLPDHKFHRDKIPLSKEGRIYLQSNVFLGHKKPVLLHGNKFKFPSTLQIHVMQTPMIDKKEGRNTVLEFLKYAIDSGVKLIAQVNKHDEKKKVKKEGVVEYDVCYVPFAKGQSITFGAKGSKKVKITCLSMDITEDHMVETSELQIEFDGMAPYTLTHVAFLEIKREQAPQNFQHTLELLNLIYKQTQPVIVHSLYGTGRAGMILYMIQAIETIHSTGKFNMKEELTKLRLIRTNAIDNSVQFMYAVFTAYLYTLRVKKGNNMEWMGTMNEIYHDSLVQAISEAIVKDFDAQYDEPTATSDDLDKYRSATFINANIDDPVRIKRREWRAEAKAADRLGRMDGTIVLKRRPDYKKPATPEGQQHRPSSGAGFTKKTKPSSGIKGGGEGPSKESKQSKSAESKQSKSSESKQSKSAESKTSTSKAEGPKETKQSPEKKAEPKEEDAPKKEVSKKDAPKKDAPKKDAPKQDAPKKEQAKQETRQKENPKKGKK